MKKFPVKLGRMLTFAKDKFRLLLFRMKLQLQLLQQHRMPEFAGFMLPAKQAVAQQQFNALAFAFHHTEPLIDFLEQRSKPSAEVSRS